MKQTTAPRDRDPLAFLAGGGEMGERIRAFDWSRTPLGAIEGWPQSLRSALSICLNSNFPIAIYWGSDLVLLYNDVWSPIPGEKHPWALGRPAREAWSEIWDIIDPLFRQVVTTGEATRRRDQLLPMRRHGYTEECYFDYTFSPIRGECGEVDGVFNAVLETTTRVIGERRLRTLRELAAWKTGQARSVDDACGTAAQILSENPHDLPFALLYRLDDAGRRAGLAGLAGVSPGTPAGPAAIDLDGPDAPWPFRQVAETGKPVEVPGLLERLGPLPGGLWPEPPSRAVVLPMAKPGQAQLAGFIVAGLSPRLAFNEDYRGFMDLLAGHVAAAVANARAYEEERRRAEELAELDRAKTAFFSNVSHEFRTPLTLMLGPVQEILARPAATVGPENRELLEVVNRNGQRLLRLVNTLLDFSRIEAGRVQAQYEPTDLARFTADLASVFRSACERAGLRLVVDAPPLTEPVYVDREMWEKVVLNLLSNAFKFTFAGEIAVTLRPVGRAVELRVRDTGTGIPAEEMPRLFERFHRVENARGRTHEGSGIGLALVQELARLHGGAVTAESELGQGTTFTVTVPLGSAHLPAHRIASDRTSTTTALGAAPYVEEAMRWLPDEGRAEGGDGLELTMDGESLLAACRQPDRVDDGERPRVLVADDNADVRQYVARLLAEHYRVETVPDGEAALAAARARPPNLILTDVMMPRLDGFGLLRELRADPRTRSLPVLMLSARAGEESRVEGMEAGADDYLVKPFGARELLARVAAHLQMARMRREAGESLRQGEERLRLALGAARMVAWQFDPETGKVILSGNAADVLGLPAGSTLIGSEQGFALIHPDDADRHRATILGVVEQGGSYLSEYRLIRPDNGAVIGLEERGHATRDEQGKTLRLVGVVMDVTERKRAEDVIRRRSEQLRRLASVATRINSALDLSSVCGIVTAEARTLIGTHQAVLGFTADQNPAQAITTTSLSEEYAAWRSGAVRADGIGLARVVCRTNRPMRLTQPELEAHPEFPEAGQEAGVDPPPRGWLAVPLVGRDGRNLGLLQLSDKVEGEFVEDDEAVLVQLAQMASVAIENARLVEDLRDADHRKDEFLATLAHELRNPLAPVRNGLHIMRLAGDDRAALDEARTLMERQVAHMVRLIDDLMDVSRITRGRLDLRRERVDLASVVRTAVETSRPLVEASGHELAITLPDRPVHVDADVTRLAQVFSNLLNNAAKYTDSGGKIALVAEQWDSEVVVRVQDNGVGIPPEMLPQVFDLFTQVDRSLERSQGGLGIGLTLVRRLVEMHGGTVVARSDGPQQGSEFVVRLPAVTPLPAQGPAASGGPEAVGLAAGRRILVVDDNRDSARTLARLLKILGNESRTVHDGSEAVRVAEEYRPDVILLDIGLPSLNGFDVARAIRGRPWGRDVAIVALTGWGQEADRRRSKEAGIDRHLVKPVDPAALETILAELRPGSDDPRVGSAR